MALSRIGNSLVRLCKTLVKDCDCCCEPVDVQCQGDPPTVKVWGATFELDVFINAASSPYGIPYWKTNADPDNPLEQQVGADTIKLFLAQLPRVPDTNCATACSFSYNCGHTALGDYGPNYFYTGKFDEDGVLREETFAYVKLTSPTTFDISPRSSPHYTRIGGHSWTIKGLKHKVVYLPSGSMGFEVIGEEDFVFTDGGPCLP